LSWSSQNSIFGVHMPKAKEEKYTGNVNIIALPY